ncbi:MAG: GHKL domain-containing protein [Anaerolineae bacterium]|nr:GHKL domain-containing protein [Anaerolineae bacterium]
MATRLHLPTAFAPAERAEPERVSEQAGRFQAQVASVMPLLLDTVGDILLVLNEQRQIIYANQTLRRFLGVADDQPVYGQRPGEVMQCSDVDQTTGGCGTSVFCRTCGMALAVVSGLQGNDASRECSIKQSDGSALEFRVRARPLDFDGERYAVISLTDISDEKRRHALERIFFHDVLNSAGLVSGYVHLMDDDYQMDIGQIRGSLRMVCDRLIEEIQAQRDLSSAEMCELGVQPRRMNTLHLLDSVKTAYEAIVAIHDSGIEIVVDAQAVDFLSDETLLRRVLGNMVKNAVEASKSGDTITLSCVLMHEQIEFSVHNPGVMPKSIKPQVFRRSFSTKGQHRGLGTYSMKLLTEQYLQGQIGFTSTPESGTRFFVRLPMTISL